MIACIQMVSGPDWAANLLQLERQLKRLPKQRPLLVTVPECFAYFAFDEHQVKDKTEQIGDGPVQAQLATLCNQYDIWLLAGTLPIQSSDPNKYFACSLLIDNQGQIKGHYNKMHLFDVQIADNKKNYQESASTLAGQQVVCLDSPIGKLGLSVCYDLRFAKLYNSLRDQGAQILCVPSAFTYLTGEAHWQVLLRARAIENQCYVVAPNQGGVHVNGRKTYGHSMIIDPWGDVLAQCQLGEDMIATEVDLDKLFKIRQEMPIIQHSRNEY